jgi:heat-inducible transcriptional repressor
MKKLQQKKPAKDQRERLVLMGLVDLYLKTGKPIGSNTLRENGFESLSSATIRNYFSKLEEEGYLRQQHSSGGRIPTPFAYKLYAESIDSTSELSSSDEEERIYQALTRESREVASYLHESAEALSKMAGCAVFLSAPRFDQDFITNAHFVNLDQHRCLCALVTDFGLVHTELLYTEKKLSSFSLKRIEQYFQAKIAKQSKPPLSQEELKIAERFYQEVMLRRIASYVNFSTEDVYRTGFSQLISYPDFSDAVALAGSLALFENTNGLRTLLSECSTANSLCCWIGEDLASFCSGSAGCSVIAVPYKIHQTVAGSIAILGPNRIPYRRLFNLLQTCANIISETLTKSLYKFKITFRLPSPQAIDMKTPKTQYLLVEDQRGFIDG